MITVRTKPLPVILYDAVQYDGTNAAEIEAFVGSAWVSDNGSTVTITAIDNGETVVEQYDWVYRTSQTDIMAPTPVDFKVVTSENFGTILELISG